MVSELQVGGSYTTLAPATIVDQADVLVAGGGTAGCVAAIAAARNGARVLLVEQRGYLGGMMTGGNAGLTKYIVHEKSQTEYRAVLAQLASDPTGVQVIGGLPMEITRRLMDAGAGIGTAGTAGSYVFTDQAEFKCLLLDMLEQAGVKLRLHVMIVDVIRQGDLLRGVVIESKAGRQALLADMLVDATGDGDVAARAGAPFVLGVGSEDVAAQQGTPLGAMQRMGVMFRMGNINMDRCFAYLKERPEHFLPQPFALLGLDEAHAAFARGEMMTINITGIGHQFQIYNTPIPGVFTFCCPSYAGNGLSVEDLTAAEVAVAREVRTRIADMRRALPGFEEAYLLDLPEMGVRETRHVQGEYVLNIDDVLSSRAFPDTIGKGCHPIDIQPIPEALKRYPLAHHWHFNIPYRCLVARGPRNLLLAGRCISNTHEASGCTRPTVQCMVTGEAAGTAAALCAQQKVAPRELDPAILRARLAQQGVVL